MSHYYDPAWDDIKKYWQASTWIKTRQVHYVALLHREHYEKEGVAQNGEPPPAQEALDAEIERMRAQALQISRTRDYISTVTDVEPVAFRHEIWPDLTMQLPFPEIAAAAQDATERWRDTLDDEPLPVGDGEFSVVSAQYEHWSGLFHRSTLHREDPTYQFQKILLPRIVTATGAPAGQHEIADADELHELCRRRLDRHNAVHNARHIVQAEYGPALKRMIETYEAAPLTPGPNPEFTEAVNAWRAIDIERMRAEAAPHRQVPRIATLEAARKNGIERIEVAAAERLFALTGESRTWLAIQQGSTYDASGLIDLVQSGRTRIEEAEDATAVESIVGSTLMDISRWVFRLSVSVLHRVVPYSNRKLELLVFSSGTAFLHTKMRVIEDDATRELAEGDYTVTQGVSGFREGVSRILVRIQIGTNVPRDANLQAWVGLSITDDGPIVVSATRDVGSV